MKKLYLLLILSLLSAQGFAGSCPDGSDPIKSISDDGTYFVYKCGGGSNNNNNNNSTAETSSTSAKASNVDSDITIYDVVFSPAVLKELLERVVSKTDYDFSKHKLVKNIQDSNCYFTLRRVVYDKSILGKIENWNMAQGNINIKDSNVEFVNSKWRVGGLSTDPSYFQDEVNIKLTDDGHLVGKMAYFNLSVKQGEIPLSPLYVTLSKHKRSKAFTIHDIKMTRAQIWIDVEDWAGGVMSVNNCKEGVVAAKKTKKVNTVSSTDSSSKITITPSNAFDGSYAFYIIFQPPEGSIGMAGTGMLMINNGILSISTDSKGQNYDSFEGRVDKDGNIQAILNLDPQISPDIKPVTFKGNTVKFSGLYDDSLEFIFYLTKKAGASSTNSTATKKVATQTKTNESSTKTTSASTSDSDPIVSKIIEVTHGDKFIVDIAEPHELAGSNIKINLRDIDAPDATKSCPKQLELGIKVRDFVSQKLENASSIKLTNFRKTNTKIIAHVIVDGIDLGDELIEKGYASKEYGYWKPYFCSALTAYNQAVAYWGKNNKKSMFWYERSIVLDPKGSNNVISAYRLNKLYSEIGEKDKSLDYLKQSASLGFVPAEEDLGYAYLNGDGVKKDPAQGKKWLKKAHDHGSMNAEYMYCSTLPKAKQKTCKF